MLEDKLEWQRYVNLWQRHLNSWCYRETWLDHTTKISHLKAFLLLISHRCSGIHGRTSNFFFVDSLFNSFSNLHYIIKILSWVSHRMLIIRRLEGVGEQHHHLCLYQWRLGMCCLISLFLRICLISLDMCCLYLWPLSWFCQEQFSNWIYTVLRRCLSSFSISWFM